MDVCMPAAAPCSHAFSFGACPCAPNLDALALDASAALRATVAPDELLRDADPSPETEAATGTMETFASLINILEESHGETLSENTALLNAELLKDLQVVAKHWTSISMIGRKDKENGGKRVKRDILQRGERYRKERIEKGTLPLLLSCCAPPVVTLRVSVCSALADNPELKSRVLPTDAADLSDEVCAVARDTVHLFSDKAALVHKLELREALAEADGKLSDAVLAALADEAVVILL